MSSNPDNILPYGRQLIDDDDVAAVEQVLRGDWLTTGPAVDEFERAFAAAVGVAEAVACANATAALHLAMHCSGLEQGEAAVVPSLTFLATANMVRHVGGEVVFADVDPTSGLMGSEQLGEAIERVTEPRLRMVLPVHYAGQCADPVGIAEICQSRYLMVVEDAAHAVATTYDVDEERVAVGACRHSTMCIFSLHPVKTITMAEGGVVTTNDGALAARLRQHRNHGITRLPDDFEQRDLAFGRSQKVNPWYYEMIDPGFNYRASDIHCALGLSQLAKLDRFVARRRDLVARYDRLLAQYAPTVSPLSRVPGCSPGWHLYVVHIDFDEIGLDRATFISRLKDRGIGTQVHYLPLHLQPYYRKRYGEIRLPGAEQFYRSALSLPLYPAMSDIDVDRVAFAIGELIEVGLRAGA